METTTITKHLLLDRLDESYKVLEDFYTKGSDSLECSIYSILHNYKHEKSIRAFDLLEELKDLSLELLEVARIEAKQVANTLKN